MIRASIWIGEEAEEALNYIRPMLEETVAYDPMATTVEEIRQDVLEKRAFVWVTLDDDDPETTRGYIIGSFYVLRGVKEFVISFAGGNMEYLLKHLDLIEDFAKVNGAKTLKIPGRPGWARVLKERDYKPVAVILKKDLEVLH